MKITLPKSKYVLELKDFISNRVFREYQKMLISDTNVTNENISEIKIKINKIYEAQDYVLENVIVSLTNEEGKVFDKPFDEIMELSTEDGNVIYKQIQELTNGASLSTDVKKNG
jgi:hypothetical protein